jgi:nucleoid-associated protein YgaU
MTRENKLSIVIAFGLLIFVGMLVADHFSIASHREVANLGSNISTPPLISPTLLIDGPPPPKQITPRSNPTGDSVHIVVHGETLRSICQDFYGNSGLADDVALWNNLQNPNVIENGSQIALPTRATLIAGSMVFQSSTSTESPIQYQPAVVTMGTYTVIKGDTLSEIAQKIMGTTKKTQLLIDVNKDVMPDPNRIEPGMILQFPLKSP